ncbi:hypothetical protein pipiens_012879 [Culex pipiens pipiens]|uniref:Uncharacterized protein n=1 Tax=Culex pipiens pipiens TaxID=38569 RepID=A0ABD1D0N1_CULPP
MAASRSQGHLPHCRQYHPALEARSSQEERHQRTAKIGADTISRTPIWNGVGTTSSRNKNAQRNRPKHLHLHHPQPKRTATVRLTATKTLQERVFWWRLELVWTSRRTGAEEVTGGAGRIERPPCGTRAHVCANRVRARGRGSLGASASWAVRKDRVVADFGVTAVGERGSMQQQ